MKQDIKQAGKKNYYAIIILIVSAIAESAVIGLARFGFTIMLPSMKVNLEITDSRAGDLTALFLTIIKNNEEE